MLTNPPITIGNLEVGRLGFGAMRITGPYVWGDPPDRDAVLALLRSVVNSGVTLIDTADTYGPGVSEELIREALHPYPPDVVIATKAGYTRGSNPKDLWGFGGRPDRLKNCCDDSLRRLGLECIDLYQLHAVDPEVPIEESVGALAELQNEGKVRHIGVSNVTVEELRKAQSVASIVSVQNRYNLAQREFEDVLAVCERDGLAFLPYSPLRDGELAGVAPELHRNLLAVAAELDATPHQVALAWLVAKSPTIAPIPGTSSVDHLQENVASLALSLTPAQMGALSAGQLNS